MNYLAWTGFGIFMNTGLAFFHLFTLDTFWSAIMVLVHFFIASILLYFILVELAEIFPQLKKMGDKKNE